VDEAHPLAERELGGEALGGAAGRRPAHHDQLRVPFRHELAERPQQRPDPLDR
jgi:hypothetical protein